MTARHAIYCSGSIRKGPSDERKVCWTDTERAEVAEGLAPAPLAFLNPDDPIPVGASTLGQFGRDMYQVMVATAVVVDARERRGIGIGVEMSAAAAFGTPVLVVAPPNTLYRRERLEYRGTVIENYVHPHVHALAARIVDDFQAAGRELSRLPVGVDRRGRVPAWLRPAIEEYETAVLPLDAPMIEALDSLRA